MQCLSVKQPAAGLIVSGDKIIENRSRKLFNPVPCSPPRSAVAR